MSMPVQKPGRSKQDYGTPWELIRAVEARWGQLRTDLAANDDGSNAKAPQWTSSAFDYDWSGFGLCWLNPPFGRIGKWAKKCLEESRRGARIIMLTPASVSSEWFAKYADGNARVVALRPRLTFEGCKHPYPKDCMLTLWGPGFDQDDLGIVPMFQTWRWRALKSRKKAA